MHPYKIAGLTLGAFAVLFGGFMIVGLLLPGGWEAERTAEIEAPPEEVFAFLNAAERWEEWTPAIESGSEVFGPPEGTGSGRRWNDPGYGRGEFVIAGSEPPTELSYEVRIEDGAIEILGRVRLEATPGGTRVVWREEGNFGWNPLLGYLAGRMNELQGAQLEASLAALERAAETAVRSRP